MRLAAPQSIFGTGVRGSRRSPLTLSLRQPRSVRQGSECAMQPGDCGHRAAEGHQFLLRAHFVATTVSREEGAKSTFTVM